MVAVIVFFLVDGKIYPAARAKVETLNSAKTVLAAVCRVESNELAWLVAVQCSWRLLKWCQKTRKLTKARLVPATVFFEAGTVTANHDKITRGGLLIGATINEKPRFSAPPGLHVGHGYTATVATVWPRPARCSVCFVENACGHVCHQCIISGHV